MGYFWITNIAAALPSLRASPSPLRSESLIARMARCFIREIRVIRDPKLFRLFGVFRGLIFGFGFASLCISWFINLVQSSMGSLTLNACMFLSGQRTFNHRSPRFRGGDLNFCVQLFGAFS